MVSPVERSQELQLALERRTLLWVDPTGLMRDNPAALIVNQESYERLEAHFSLEEFDAPQAVSVRMYSSEHGEVVRLLVKDGLTRTKFAHDHKGKPPIDYPSFDFTLIPVRDVTSSVLRNQKIVPLSERE